MGLSDSLKGALDQAKEKATELAGKHNSTIDSGLDKVGDLADKATKGKYSDKIHSGRDKAKESLDHLAEKSAEPTAPTDPAEPTDPPVS
ncbi:antitoxin [Streptacidiphilus sp. PAMC 29251]